MVEYRNHPVHKLRVGSDGSVIGPSGKALKIRLSNCGYARVVAYVNGKGKSFSVHRLVAESFIHKTAQFVNHKDGVKLNNCASNLEWCTRSENARHAYALGLIDTKARSRKMIDTGTSRGIRNGRAKLTDDAVRAIRSEPKTKYGTSPWNKYGISDVMYGLVRRQANWSHIK